MKEKIRILLEDQLPLVDLDSETLYQELDSLGVTTILMTLSDEFGILLDSRDATPKNLRSLDSLVALVERKLAEKQ
ncbi:MAG: acyl carrier protein [Bacteroidales bacterium]|jgi:acyl carrier protein|nr:acyl carrier protein [Bacteroidales bacterium]MBR3540738.1 acyl carrier protein [Bacteroidales bacterium]